MKILNNFKMFFFCKKNLNEVLHELNTTWEDIFVLKESFVNKIKKIENNQITFFLLKSNLLKAKRYNSFFAVKEKKKKVFLAEFGSILYSISQVAEIEGYQLQCTYSNPYIISHFGNKKYLLELNPLFFGFRALIKLEKKS